MRIVRIHIEDMFGLYDKITGAREGDDSAYNITIRRDIESANLGLGISAATYISGIRQNHCPGLCVRSLVLLRVVFEIPRD